MSIRKVEPSDFVRVNAICIDAFMSSVAPTLSEKGIKTFRSIASVEGFSDRVKADNEILVYEKSGSIVGILEFKKGRHIAMLFVDPDAQKKGVGRSLISAILPFAREDILTVSASIPSVPAYLSYGFICTGEVAESAGLKYQPMEMKLNGLL